MNAKSTTWIDQRLVKALGHPLRAQILAILNERVASPNELARETGQPLGNVSYHVRLLTDLDCLELVKTEPRRGAVEHYYKASVPAWVDKSAWKNLPRSLRSSVSNPAMAAILEEAADALRSGAFDSRPDRHLSRTPLMLDEAGWSELAETLDDLLERALALKAEAADRAVKNGTEDELMPCSLVLMHYSTAG